MLSGLSCPESARVLLWRNWWQQRSGLAPAQPTMLDGIANLAPWLVSPPTTFLPERAHTHESLYPWRERSVRIPSLGPGGYPWLVRTPTTGISGMHILMS